MFKGEETENGDGGVFMSLSRVNCSKQISTTQSFTHSSSVWKRIRRTTARNLMGRDIDSLVNFFIIKNREKAYLMSKAAWTMKTKERIDSKLPVSRQPFTHFQEHMNLHIAYEYIRVCWEDECCNSEHPSFFFPLPELLLLSLMWYMMESFFGQWGQLSWLCALPAST